MSFHVPHQYRVVAGTFATDESDGNNGLFIIPDHEDARKPYLRVIASDGLGWEHVSVSFPDHMPSWEDMCKVKDLFWGKEDCVIQYHPPEQEYVNNHSFCLHLWRPIGVDLPLPPSYMVGFKSLGKLV